MDRITDPVVARFLADYLPALREAYRPETVLLFGSRVRGDALEDSDLDLVLVADRFRGVPFLERAIRVLAHIDLPWPVDLLCYTPEEFADKRAELGIVSAAVEEGIEV